MRAGRLVPVADLTIALMAFGRRCHDPCLHHESSTPARTAGARSVVVAITGTIRPTLRDPGQVRVGDELAG